MVRTLVGWIVAVVSLVATAQPLLAGPTLDAVRARGVLNCGVTSGLAGFSAPDDKGAWTGIDVDFCKAVAAAIFGADAKVKYAPLSAKERFTALQSGEVDVLSRNTTWTMSRDTTQGLTFSVINYFDGQGFMVKKASGVTSAKQLGGATVCVQSGTTSELNLADFFRTNNLPYKVVVFDKNAESVSAYEAGRCDAFTTDASGLYSERLKLGAVEGHVVLPEIISKEPLGPVVRQGDEQWINIVRWTHFAMVGAEELGITKANVRSLGNSANPEVRRLIGAEGDFGKGIGLSRDWAVQIIEAVGNYGECFERNLGTGSRLAIARGQNRLWTEGGLQYAPPIR
ncbi:MAG: amino acid ABC transporter substrate-binding protein [Hyphomicrobiaceae bacterium]